MRYVAIFLIFLLALVVICGGVGLLAYSWFALADPQTLPPAPVDPIESGILPTPTLATGGNAPLVPPAAIATTPSQLAPTEPFDGTFVGRLTGNDGSTAPVTLVLLQSGTAVSGDITIGEGLSLDGGSCGAQAVPAGTQQASGQTDPTNPNHLNAGASFIVQGFTITLNLDATLAADGNTLTTEAAIDLPFLCADPTITGSFLRQ